MVPLEKNPKRLKEDPQTDLGRNFGACVLLSFMSLLFSIGTKDTRTQQHWEKYYSSGLENVTFSLKMVELGGKLVSVPRITGVN